MKLSRGEIIAPLDDDDEWERSRLQRISTAFSRHPGVGLWHNNQDLIDAKGMPFSRDTTVRLFRHPSIASKDKTIILNFKRLISKPELIRKFEIDFNASSIATKRDALEDIDDLLANYTFGSDTLLLYGALRRHYDIAVCPLPLTKYRIHTHNASSIPSVGHKPSSLATTIERLQRAALTHLNCFQLLRQKLVSIGEVESVRVIDFDMTYYALLNAMISGSRKTTWCALLEYFSYPRNLLTYKGVIIALASLLDIITPQLFNVIYLKVR